MSFIKKVPLHIQILVALVLGLAFGLVAVDAGWLQWTKDWVNPWGTIFVRLLKLIAVPLVFGSLISGVASLSDLQKLSRIGGKTIGIYLFTTFIALVIGLGVVNLIRPGDNIPEQTRIKLQSAYSADVKIRTADAKEVQDRGPLDALVKMVPENIMASSGDNRLMLQIVFFCILFGVGLIQVSQEQAQPLVAFFESVNEVTIKMVDMIMLMAPLGVFALMAKTVTAFAGGPAGEVLMVLKALALYCGTVTLGLGLHTFVVLPAALRFLSPMSVVEFFRKIAPVQLLAFSTSSSGATLPVTMETVENDIGVSEEISSFVLPLGATINMDGTGLYQAVAAVFIAQAVGIDLTLGAQASIVLTALLASIGTAAVPGAGIIMLVIILESIGVPSSGIALIIGVDRVLDMLRTATNVTGDAVVATIVAASEGQLKKV